MIVTDPIADETATRLAFGMMRSAYLDLARILRSIEEDTACELLAAVENRLQYRLGKSAHHSSDEIPEGTAIAFASHRVQQVLREAVAS